MLTVIFPDAEVVLLSERSMSVLLWVALVGYLLVLVTTAPLLRRANGSNYVIVGIMFFTVLVGVSLFGSLVVHIQGLGVLVLNAAWIILLFQTGVLHGLFRTVRLRMKIPHRED